MKGWTGLLVAALIAIGVGIGVAAFTYDKHPMRSHYSMAGEGCAEDSGLGSDQRIDCFDNYRRTMDRSDQKDMWVAAAAGVGAAAIVWLLIHFLVLRPRRKRGEA